MKNLKPIPKYLLPHTAIVEEPDKGSQWANSFHDPITISNVRLEPAQSLSPNEAHENPQLTGLLFIDAENSEGAKNIAVGSRVTVGDYVGYAEKVNGYFGYAMTPHHWEVELSG